MERVAETGESVLMELVLFGVMAVLGVLLLVFMIRLWGVITEADEYFARENQRYRREYERQHRK